MKVTKYVIQDPKNHTRFVGKGKGWRSKVPFERAETFNLLHHAKSSPYSRGMRILPVTVEIEEVSNGD